MEQRISEWLRRVWKEKRPFVLIAAGAVALLVGISLYLLMQPKPSPVVTTTQKSAARATLQGNYDQAYIELKAVNGQAKTMQQKVSLYNDLAAAAANADKPVEAIRYLDLKHQTDPSTKPADEYMLATLYQQIGDTRKAVDHYMAALDYYQSLPSESFNSARIEGLKATIADLQAGND